MNYISGFAMGNIIQSFLLENDIYTPENYKSAYACCKQKCNKTENGIGHAKRYRYWKDDIMPVLRNWLDKERLGSNPLTCLMDHASVKMRNLEASSFKPNSPKQAHHEALASCVLDER